MKKFFSIMFIFVFSLTVASFTGCGCEHKELTKLTDTATCESDGIATYKCNKCNKKIEKTSVKKGHDYSIYANYNATCEKDGEIKYRCSRCHSIKSTTKKATGHNGTIKCKNCNQNFYELIYNNLQPKTFKDTSSSVNSTYAVKYSKTNNGVLCITWTTTYDAPLFYNGTTVFTIKADGSWAYTINGNYTGSFPRSGTLSGELPYAILYLYTSKDITNKNIELPVSSSNNGSMTELLYSGLKIDFCNSLVLLKGACVINGKMTMRNLGFSNY